MAEPTNRSNQPPPPNNQDGIGLPTPAPAPPPSAISDPKNNASLEKFFAEIEKLKDSVAKTNELLEQQATLQKAIAEMQSSADRSSINSKKEELATGEKSYDETKRSLDDIVKTLEEEKRSRDELAATISKLKEDISKTSPEKSDETDKALVDALGQKQESVGSSKKESIAAILQSSNAQQVALNTSIDTMREIKESDDAIEADVDKQTKIAEEEKMRKVGSPLTPGEQATIKLLKEDNSLLKKIRELLDSSILSKIFKIAIFGLLVLTGIIIYKYFPQILEFVKGLKDKIVDFVKEFDWKKTWEWLKTLPEKILDGLRSLKDKIVGAYEYLTTRGFKGIMTDLKDGLFGFLGKWGGYIWEKIKESLVWYGKELALAAGTLLMTGIGMAADAIWDAISWLGTTIKDGFLFLLQKFVAINAVIGVLEALWGFFRGTKDIMKVFKAIGSGYIGSLGAQFANTITKAFGPMLEVGGTTANMFSKIAGSVSGLFSAAASSTGPIGRILSPVLNLITRAAPFISSALGIFVKALPIIGMIFLAWDAIKGAIMGFTKDGIAGAIKGLIANVLAGLSFGLLSFDQIYGWIDSAINWVAEGLVAMWDGITSLISSMGSWISTGLSSMWDGVVDLFTSVGNAFMNFGMFLFSIPGKILGFITGIAASLLKKVVDILPDWAVPGAVAQFITDLTKVPKEGSPVASAPSGSKVVAIISPPKMSETQKIRLEQREDEKRFLNAMRSAEKEDPGMRERLRRQMASGSSVAANTINSAMSSNNLAKMTGGAGTTIINAPTNNVAAGGNNSGPIGIAATNNRNTDPTFRALSFQESPAM
jgi:hypothetical protein